VKKVLLACLGVSALAVAACSQEGPGTTPGTAGSSGGSSSPGNGGTIGQAGNSAGGTTGQAGDGAGGSSNAGSGGSTSGNAGNGDAGSGGSGNAGSGGNGSGNAGRGGTNGTAGAGGGNAGNGGGTAGSGNAGRGGSAGGTAGSGTGTAGRGGTGGSAGSGGTTGTGGTGGGGALTPDAIVGTAPDGLDGYYWEVTPSGNTALSGTNYPFNAPNTSNCPGGAWNTAGYINTKPVITVKGTTGQKYTVNVNVRGVVGTRCYEMGTPGSTAAGVESGPNNGWYAGGKQYNDSIWNTMEIRVAPKVTGQPNQTLNSGYDIYFANSFQNSNSSAAGTAQWWCQREATYEIGYNASFPVMGGGTITLVTHDSNCRALQNCGATLSLQTCSPSASRTISMSGVSPAAPASFPQPRSFSLNGTTYYPQWLWIDVTSVTSP